VEGFTGPHRKTRRPGKEKKKRGERSATEPHDYLLRTLKTVSKSYTAEEVSEGVKGTFAPLWGEGGKLFREGRGAARDD